MLISRTPSRWCRYVGGFSLRHHSPSAPGRFISIGPRPFEMQRRGWVGLVGENHTVRTVSQPAQHASLFSTACQTARQKACELLQQMTRHRAEYPPEHALTSIFNVGTCQSQQAFGHKRSRPCHQEKAYRDLPGQSEPYLAVKLFGLMPLHLRSCINCTTRSATAPPFLACQLRPPPRQLSRASPPYLATHIVPAAAGRRGARLPRDGHCHELSPRHLGRSATAAAS